MCIIRCIEESIHLLDRSKPMPGESKPTADESKPTADDSLHIPNDLTACQTLLVEQARAIMEQRKKITALQQQVEEQQLTINELLQRAFRHRSERYLGDPKQLTLDFGDTPEIADTAAGLADAVEEAKVIIRVTAQ